ncbi:MAG TPA: von Willebrand factor type A domain-containing protein [Gemmatimonadaceae bacterium]|nr:von Willebrand factor type A domain-containing protein [Gemmatimonadaceae bacterium]
MPSGLVRVVLPIAPLLAAFALSSVTDTVIITGRVTSEQGPALQGANVYITEMNVSVGTNEEGAYRIALAPERVRGQSVQLRVRAIGFQPQARPITLNADTITENFALKIDINRLAEIAVTGTTGAVAGAVPPTATTPAPARAPATAPPPATAPTPVVPSARAPGVVYGSPATSPEIVVPRGSTSYKTAEPWPGAERSRRGHRSDSESYGQIVDNPFQGALENPLSTFSIDVDRASYSNIRRFVTRGQLPPRDAVRIEELLNYFPYEYPRPAGPHPFSVHTEVARAPWRPEHLLVRVGLQARRVDRETLPPSNLVFLIDVSGSMQPENKLPLVKRALRLLVEQLREQDRVAIVVYAGSAGIVLPSTPGDRKDVILAAIGRLEAGGSTAGGQGLLLAYDVARRSHMRRGNNRVILATDGDFNVGPSSDAAMEHLIAEKRDQGTFLSVLGFGVGNLKDSKMEILADKGNGNYAYIDNIVEAQKVLVDEMAGTLLTVARDVKLQVEFNPAHVAAYRLIGYENRVLRSEDFDDDRKDAGEMGAGHSVTALYEVIPVDDGGPDAPRDQEPLRYQQPVRPPTNRTIVAGRQHELMYVKFRYKLPNASASRRLDHTVAWRGVTNETSADFRFAASVAAFGMILRQSEHRGTATLDDVIAIARRSLGEDPGGYRADFIRLAESVREHGLLATRHR